MAKGRNQKVEKRIENKIVDFFEKSNYYTFWINSWKLCFRKNWYMNVIHLAPQWTPDIFALKWWKTIFVEVKKDEKTYNNWIRLEKLFLNKEKIAKSRWKEEWQIKAKYKILKSWWHHILTYNFKDFYEKYKLIEKV